MQKIAGILIIGVLLVSCSVAKKGGKSEQVIPSTGNLAQDIKNQNITADGFFIQKGEIEIISKDINEKFVFTAKFEYPGRYLISLKSRTGIEGARIYISGDSVIANDRMNKTIYSGSSQYLQRNFGFSLNSIALIFGDIILNKECEKEITKCTGNELSLDCAVRGVRFEYKIDCRKKKLIAAEQEFSSGQKGAEISYSDFNNIKDRLIPEKIEVHQNQFNTTIKIKIVRVEFPWKGTINFIPGRDYEKIELL